MVRKTNARVVLNRQKFEGVRLVLADGLLEAGRQMVLEISNAAPDATPYGVGLLNQGAAIGYVDGKKIGDVSLDGRAPRKPRGARVKKGLTTIVGWGFPGRFLEFGTSKMAARPFFTPASKRIDVRGEVEDYVKPRLRNLR